MHADQAVASSGGMTLDQLEQVAREAGIDTAVIRRAAAQLDGGAHESGNAFLGSADHVVVERTIDFALDTAEFDHLLDVVRGMSREVGEVSTVGRQFGWKGTIDGSKADVTVSVGEAATTFRVRIDLEHEILGHFMLKGVLGGVGGGLISWATLASLAGGPVGVLAAAGVAGGCYVWARRGLRRSHVTFADRANQMVGALVVRAGEITRPRIPD